MATLELHFFDADDPNGSTIWEATTDDEFVKSVELDIQRDSLGHGKVTLARKVGTGLISRRIVAPEVLVRVLIPEVDTSKYFYGFWINPRQQQVVSRAEKGGEGFTFGGPGPKHYLTRAILRAFSYTGMDDFIDRDAGFWTWDEAAKAGRILDRLLQEDADGPVGPFLPDITQGFNNTIDSDGVAWVENVSEGNEDFTLRIQHDYLKILWKIEDASGIVTQFDLGTTSAPTLKLDAWQTYGRDLTGSAWASDVVHWIEGDPGVAGTGNIRNDLNVEGSSYRKASHALMKGNDGLYEISERPGWSPGELLRMIGGSYETGNEDVLDRAGQRLLNRQQHGENQIDLRIVSGFSPGTGLYFPGFQSTDGHFWVGDTVSLTTGGSTPSVLDYQDEPQTVTGIQLELNEAVRDDTIQRRARSFDITVLLNEERKSSNTPVDLAGNRGTIEAPPNPIRLCLATIPPTDETFVATRLYTTGTSAATAGAPSPAFNSMWEDSTGTGRSMLSTTPGEGSGTGSITWSGTGIAQDDVRLQQYLWPLPGTGTLEGWFRGYHQAKSRSGIGINENLQSMIGQCNLRVVSSDGSTFRGTAYAGHSLTAPGTNKEWPPFAAGDSSAKSRAMPPLSTWDTALGVALTPVAWQAGDYLVLEIGVRNFGTAVTGATFYSHYDNDPDMPEEEDVTSNLRAWFEIVSIEASEGGAGRVGAGHVDLVGTSTRAKRCDAKDHVNRLIAPTPIDDRVHGYPTGTLWHVLDDLDDPTRLIATYISLQDSTDSAIWVLYGPNDHTHEGGQLPTDASEGDDLRYDGSEWIADPAKWEAVTNGEDVFVWEGDDLVHEFNPGVMT